MKSRDADLSIGAATNNYTSDGDPRRDGKKKRDEGKRKSLDFVENEYYYIGGGIFSIDTIVCCQALTLIP